MANIDLTTGKITGANPGTKKYYHEVGHSKFELEHRYGNSIRVIQDLSLKTIIFSAGLGVMYNLLLLKIVIGISILLNIFSEIYEESWCWIYANKQLPGEKEDDERIERKQVQEV